ncbi:MAG: SpoIIE family protein phosphatase [Candidatus Limivicinus sp.]|jgi:hypothetical protein
MKSDIFLDRALISRNHDGEAICGDFSRSFGDENTPIFVMSDGLGSGVKANILATLTCNILGHMMEHGLPLAECVDTIAASLPVCRERHMAYSTFTAAEVAGDNVYLVEYDNPPAVYIRDGEILESRCRVRFVGDKEIHERKIGLLPGDTIIIMSDGVTHSGIGRSNLDGWSAEGAGKFVIESGALDKSAAYIAALLDRRCSEISQNALDDDRTVAVMRFVRRSTVNLLMGPPKNPEDDEQTLSLFFGKRGQHIVCGGSTGSMVSRFLDRPIKLIENSGDGVVPDMASLEGVDLLTEGIITMQKVLELNEDIKSRPELLLKLGSRPEELLYRKLFLDCSNVNIFFGMAANTAHDDIGIGFEQKLETINQLEQQLRERGKSVKKDFF